MRAILPCTPCGYPAPRCRSRLSSSACWRRGSRSCRKSSGYSPRWVPLMWLPMLFPPAWRITLSFSSPALSGRTPASRRRRLLKSLMHWSATYPVTAMSSCNRSRCVLTNCCQVFVQSWRSRCLVMSSTGWRKSAALSKRPLLTSRVLWISRWSRPRACHSSQ